MNSLRDKLIKSVRDPSLQKLLQQLASACDQADSQAFTRTLSAFENRLSAHDCKGLQPLTDHLHSLLDHQSPTDDLSQLVTMAAGYLALLQDQQIDDHPLIIVHTLKQCPSQTPAAELTVEDWLTPDIRPSKIRPVSTPELDIDAHRLASIFQVLLLRWLQQNDLPALKRLAQICRYLRSKSNQPEVMLLWQAAEALAIALTEKALTDPGAAQGLLGKLPAFIRTQIEHSEAALKQEFPDRLLKQLLLAVASADSQHSLINDLQHTQQLNFIAHQQLLLQSLDWPSASNQSDQATETDVDDRLDWLEQTDTALDQYHQHLHRWFKHPTDDHKKALLNTLGSLQTDAEQQSLPVIAALYQLMQQLISAAGSASEQLTDLLEQAYQQLNQQMEGLFENQPTPDIAPFAATVEAFVDSQESVSDKPRDAGSSGETFDTTFVMDADEHLQSIQSQLKLWQQSLPASPPGALSEIFKALSTQARNSQQHAIADLADSLYALLKHHAAQTESQAIFELIDTGHSKLSEMQEQLAQDLPVTPARNQLAAISDFIKQQRHRALPIRKQTPPALPALNANTLKTLEARQRTTQQAMQTLADQHLLLWQQVRRLQNQQPEIAGEMQRTLTAAQSALSTQMHSQAMTRQTLASASLQPLDGIRTAIENSLQALNQHRQQAVILAFESGYVQLPDFMLKPLTQSIDNLLSQLLAFHGDYPLTLNLTADTHHTNVCLEINLTGPADDSPQITDIEKVSAEMLLQSIGGRIKVTSSGLRIELPRVEQPLRCLITRCGDKFYAIAAEAIDSISHIDAKAFDYQPGQSMSYQHNDHTCQLVSPEFLTESAGHVISDGQPVIITRDDKQPIAITVDEVINTQSCVFELLGPQIVSYPTLRGVSANEGRLLMLLDTTALNASETTATTTPTS